MDVDAVGVHATEDVLDGAVLPSCVHGLEDEEHGVAVLRVHHLLEFVDFTAELVDEIAVVGFVLVKRGNVGRAVDEVRGLLLTAGDSELGEIDFEFHVLGIAGERDKSKVCPPLGRIRAG